ncbi:TKL/DRK protein kinase [Phytophthora cinnamomi]|uniref:TKL/DRK protein kinase n=1 Tax=Phytophthora cinnamomi TaxID=4785 RepID=UPI00355A02DE|nr:TKL/DRK protein kinase [Phytophthora cinnamomi]
MFEIWSTYDNHLCSGAPSGVFIDNQNACTPGNTTSCAATYDENMNTIGYVDETCGSDRGASLAALFNGVAYLSYDYYSDGECTVYGYTLGLQANGECENAYLFGLSDPFLSGTIVRTGNIVVSTHNYGPLVSSWDCPGAGPLNYSELRIPMANVGNGKCVVDGGGLGAIYFGNVSTMVDTSSSGPVTSNSASPISSSPSSGSTPPSTSTSGSGANIGMIAGIAGGALAFVAAIIATSCYLMKRSRARGSIEFQSLQDGLIHSAGTGGTDPSTLGTGLWNDDAIIAARVPRDQVNIQDLIARGGSGEVYRGTYNSKAVAVKMLFPEVRSDLKKVNAFLAEAKLMNGLSHPHIVQFVGVSWGSLNDLCVLTELMKGGDLRALLKAYDERGHPQGFNSDKIRIAYHAAQALMYLHSLSPVVIHRDLKSKNVLLSHDLTAKLTDFGVSRERQENTMTAGVGTLLWMAPEVMMAEHYSEMADIFSFGVLLSELDLQTLPYSHARIDPMTGKKIADTAILQKVASGAVQVAFSSACVSLLVQLAQECVSLDPSSRPSAPMVVYRLQTIMKEWFGM